MSVKNEWSSQSDIYVVVFAGTTSQRAGVKRNQSFLKDVLLNVAELSGVMAGICTSDCQHLWHIRTVSMMVIFFRNISPQTYQTDANTSFLYMKT